MDSEIREILIARDQKFGPVLVGSRTFCKSAEAKVHGRWHDVRVIRGDVIRSVKKKRKRPNTESCFSENFVDFFQNFFYVTRLNSPQQMLWVLLGRAELWGNTYI